MEKPAQSERPFARDDLLGPPRLIELLKRFPPRLVWAVYVLIMGFLSIAIMAGVAMISRSAFVFPSLGPTAILFFFHPMAASASPRDAVCGHAIGIACGWAALWAFGLQRSGPEMSQGIGMSRLLAVALSLAATAFFMILLKVTHPPAGATALVISLGLITRPLQFLVIEIAVVLLCVQAIVINRGAGLHYPFWVGRVDSAMEEVEKKDGSTLEESKQNLIERK